MKIDYPKLNAELIKLCPGILMEWYPKGVVKGHRFIIGNTDGEEGESLAVDFKTGGWKDFATEENGDLVELYAQRFGLKNSEAAEKLIKQYAIRGVVEDELVSPVSKIYIREAPLSDASAVYEYLNTKGELLFYVLRHDKGSKKKYFTPLAYWRDSGWQKKMPPGKRPLYGLHVLANHPESSVVIVEGEKCADAGTKLSADYIFVTWPGGSSAYKQADWSALAGRNVVLWPDADDAGIKAMNGLVAVLKKSKVKAIKMIDVAEQSGGWDVADAVSDGWGAKQFTDWMEAHKKLIYPLPDEPEKIGLDNIYFRSLGYRGKDFIFYIQKTGQVMSYRGTELEAWGNLHTLAPSEFWADGYNSVRRVISNSLIRQSEDNGYYDPSIVRGRGVWEDDGRSVLHLGNKLIVDGADCDIRTFKTDYIYEQRVAMHVETREPLESSEATKLVDICNLIGWEESISGFLLAGWIFSSIICGVLPWRSHIYLTGPVGSGKTWVIDNIINRCLRGIGVVLQGNTSEPAIRQSMRGDARPVLFDESEADGKESATRIQKVFELARAASSENAAPIVKGTQSQSGAIEYVFRSCFVFASIQPSMIHYADESRITLLRLANPYGGGGARFQKLLSARNKVMTDEFCDGLISRAVFMAPTIRHNHCIFAEAGEEMFGSRRASDQFAMMLSGLYGLQNDRKLQDHEDAKEFIVRFEWKGRLSERPIPSETTLLDTILQSEVVTEYSNKRVMLGELVADEIDCASSEYNGKFVELDLLRRYGVKVVGNTLHIANNCVGLKRLLKDTPWSARWNQTLINIKGAKKSDTGEFFAAGIHSRSVIIPMPNSLRDGEDAV